MWTWFKKETKLVGMPRHPVKVYQLLKPITIALSLPSYSIIHKTCQIVHERICNMVKQCIHWRDSKLINQFLNIKFQLTHDSAFFSNQFIDTKFIMFNKWRVLFIKHAKSYIVRFVSRWKKHIHEYTIIQWIN